MLGSRVRKEEKKADRLRSKARLALSELKKVGARTSLSLQKYWERQERGGGGVSEGKFEYFSPLSAGGKYAKCMCGFSAFTFFFVSPNMRPLLFFRAILRRQRERRTDRWESCTHSPRFPPSYEKGQFVRKSRRGKKGGKKKTDEAEEMGQKAQHASTVKGGVGVRGD